MTAQRRFRAGHRARVEVAACAAIAVLLALFALSPPAPVPAEAAPAPVTEFVNAREDVVVPPPEVTPPPARPGTELDALPEPEEIRVAAQAPDLPEPPAPAASGSAVAAAFQPFSDAPVPVFTPQPEYPELARSLGIEGRVLCLVTLDEKGRVTAVEVVESAAPVLDEAAREALFRWIFTPASQSGQPVAAQVMIPVLFALR